MGDFEAWLSDLWEIDYANMNKEMTHEIEKVNNSSTVVRWNLLNMWVHGLSHGYMDSKS
jgi:hypothetical protein